MYLTIGSQLGIISDTQLLIAWLLSSPSLIIDLISVAWSVNDIEP